MNSKYNNIDGVLKKELRNYSVSAPDDVWNRIEAQLDYNKRIKFQRFYRIAAAIAAIAIIGSVTLLSLNNKSKTELTSSNEIIVENKPVEKDVREELSAQQISTSSKQEMNQAKIQEPAKSNKKELYAESVESAQKTDNNEFIEAAGESTELNKLSLLPAKIHSQEITYNIAYNNTSINQENYFGIDAVDFYASMDESAKSKANERKWLIGGEFSPLYSYRLITQGAIVESSNYDQLESPVTSYAGGVNVQYKTNKRLTIQTGVYYSTMGQALDYLSVYANQAYSLVSDKFKDYYIQNYELQNSAGTISFSTPYVVVDERAHRVRDISSTKGYFDVSDPIFQDLKAEIQQNFQYIEVPIIIRYKLIDKVLDLNFIGGLGANFLIGNNVYLVQGNAREMIGETSGVNTINYSGSVGFGIEYPVLNRISIRLEPSLKYYLNAINSNSSYESHPYAFGIYTGFNYSF